MTVSRRAVVLFALFASLLVASASPVSAASLALVSEHTTAAEFSNADLESMQVLGSGETGSVGLVEPEWIDGFEDGDLDPASGAWTDWPSSDVSTTTSDPINGSTSGVLDGSFASIYRSQPTQGNLSYTFRVQNPGSFSGGDDFYFYLYSQDSGVLGQIRFVGDETVECGSQSCGTWNPYRTYRLTYSPDFNNGTMTYSWSAVNHDGDSHSGTVPLSSPDATGWDRARFNPSGETVVFDDVEGTRPTDSGSYVGPEHSGSELSEIRADLSLSNVSATVTAQTWNGSGWVDTASTTASTSGTATVPLSNPADRVRTRVEFEATDATHSAELRSESAWFEPRAPGASNLAPPDGANVETSPVNVSVRVSDADFATAQGDSVTARLFVNGEARYNETVASNTTVATDVSDLLAGANSYRWELAGSYGATTTTTANRTVSTPATLSVFNASDTDQLVDGVTLTIQFFGETGTDRVFERTTDDGTISLAGLPADERLIVSVQPDQGYVTRRVVLESIYAQKNVFILPESADAVEVVFGLDDPTGQFPPEETTLIVERPITKNGNTTYQSIAGDTFGATGSYSVVLQTAVRYRLRVSTESGESSRILGVFTTTSATSETLQIQRIEPTSNTNAGTIYGAVEGEGADRRLAVRFTETNGDAVESVEYRVVRPDGSVFIANTTDTADEFAHIYPIANATGSVSYVIEYSITYASGETVSGRVHVGELGGLADRFAADPQVLSIISWIAILSTMGLLVIVNTKLAPVGGVGMATALSIIGTVAVPMPLLGVAGAISVFVLVGDST